MFFQALLYICLIVGAVWVAWKFIVKPILEGQGIQVEEEEDKTIRTPHTKKLKQMKKDFAEKSKSAQAAEEGVIVSKGIDDLEDRINEADDKMGK